MKTKKEGYENGSVFATSRSTSWQHFWFHDLEKNPQQKHVLIRGYDYFLTDKVGLDFSPHSNWYQFDLQADSLYLQKQMDRAEG